MDRQIDRRIPDIEDPVFNRDISPADYTDRVYHHPSKMEEQGVPSRGKGICRSGHRQAQVQEKGQGALLREKDVAQGKIHQRASTFDWARKKEESRHAIRTKAIAAEKRDSPPATKSTGISYLAF